MAIVENSFHRIPELSIGRSDFRPIETEMKKRINLCKLYIYLGLLRLRPSIRELSQESQRRIVRGPVEGERTQE
jgi:hypothetical protein